MKLLLTSVVLCCNNFLNVGCNAMQRASFSEVVVCPACTLTTTSMLLKDLAEVISGRGYVPKKEIIGRLRMFEEIEEVIDVQTSDFDLIVKARSENLKRLSALIEELRSIEGMEEISSAIMTEEIVLSPPTLFKKSVQ